jgi:protein SCO1/2
MRTAINVVVILLIAVGLGLYLRTRQSENPPLAGGEIDRPLGEAALPSDAAAPVVRGEGWLTNFSLTERSGETLTSESLRGEPYVASFFFSTCPSVCKLQNEKMQQLQTEFAGEPVRLVAITVDPETDTPEVLREYAKRYKADPQQWLFLTGQLDYIRRVGAEMYSVPVDKQLHTERFILVGADGEIIDYYTWTDPGQFKKLKEDLRKLLAEDGREVSRIEPQVAPAERVCVDLATRRHLVGTVADFRGDG